MGKNEDNFRGGNLDKNQTPPLSLRMDNGSV